MRRPRRRITMVVTGAALLLAACAQGGDRLKTAGTDSATAVTATRTSVTPQQVAPDNTAILTPVTPIDTSTTLHLANAAASPTSTSGATSLPGTSSESGVATPPTQPTTTPSPTAPPPTTPPSTTTQGPQTTSATLPPETTPLTEDEAISVWETYLGEAAARDYSTAWTNLSQQYQIKYLGYDNFRRFWDTVQGAGVRSYSVVSTLPNGLTLELHVWYGRRKDNTVSNEIVDIDVIKDMATGIILIDDYRYLGHG